MTKNQEQALNRQSQIEDPLDWRCAMAANIVLKGTEHYMSTRAKDKLKFKHIILRSGEKSIAQLINKQTLTQATSGSGEEMHT